MNVLPAPELSICIATFCRAAFIGATLDSIVSQLVPCVEVVIVDGNSSDETPAIVRAFCDSYPQIKYYREPTNSGVDRDYDKAVGYASGTYCWLMTDDDLLEPTAIETLLPRLREAFDLIVINAKMCTVDFSKVLRKRFLTLSDDKEYGPTAREAFFREITPYLSFIGAVVIRRELWESTKREPFFGTLFAHVGVIYQAPGISAALVIANPLIAIRYGNALWTPRAFEIWMLKWPLLIWSFPGFSDEAKAIVTPREPWRRWRKLGVYRAIGAYSWKEYETFVRPRASGLARLPPALIAVCPQTLANALASLYCLFINRNRMNVYDLLRSRHANWASRLAARSLGL